MSRRIHRRPPLSDHAKAAYHRRHFAIDRHEYSDRLADLYEMCHTDGVPFICIIQPRRFCTLELDLDPAGFRMNHVEQAVVTLWGDNAIRESPAPSGSKSVHVGDTGAIIRGLELEQAKSLAFRIWAILAKTEKEIKP